jgi:hypothetical protein
MAPRPVGDDTYAISNIFKASTEIPLIDIERETENWIGAILANPAEYEGKVLCAATRLYTMQEVVDKMGKVTGKAVAYKQVPDEVFKEVLPPGFQEQYLQMLQLIRDSAIMDWSRECWSSGRWSKQWEG